MFKKNSISPSPKTHYTYFNITFVHFLCCLLLVSTLANSACFNRNRVPKGEARPPGKPSNTANNPKQGQTVVREHGTDKLKPQNNNTTTEIFTPKTNDLEKPVKRVEPVKLQKNIQSSYDIAIMLPFNANSYIPNASYDSIPEKSVMALELYEGMLVGLDHLQQQGLQLTAHIYDTEKKPSKVGRILSSPEVQGADFILGPIYNKPLKTVAAFAKERGIYHVSPLSPSTKVTSNNPYYFIANPSIETHCEALFNYLMEAHKNKHYVTISNATSSKESKTAGLFARFAREYVGNGEFSEVNMTQLNYASHTEEEIAAYLSDTQENVIIVTSFNELFINDVIRKLHMLRDTYRITLVGMPNWLEISSLQLDYLAHLNFHVSTPFWVDEYSAVHQRFKQDYITRFQTYPSNNAAKGYDLITHFGRTLKDHGSNFGLFLNEVATQGTYTNYQFAPAVNNTFSSLTASPDYYENKYVNILRYRPDFIFEKVK